MQSTCYTHIHSLCKLLTAQNGIGGCGTDQHGGSAYSTCKVCSHILFWISFVHLESGFLVCVHCVGHTLSGKSIYKCSNAKDPSLTELLHFTIQHADCFQAES